MPFSLRSDEELVAEAKRALEALGVEVVIDRTSSSRGECEAAARSRPSRSQNRASIVTSRAVVEEAMGPSSDAGAAVIWTSRVQGQSARHIIPLIRNRQHLLDVAAAATAWWGRISADPQWRTTTITCCACGQRRTRAGAYPPCQQCYASVCTPCIQRFRNLFKCPECAAWYLEATRITWDVPWDMPRPAPTRRQAFTAAAAAPSSSALPQRMAAAVGADGWLRPPPQHQRMHPVDVLVDGVLAALDGTMRVTPMRWDCFEGPTDAIRFTRLPLSDCFHEGSVNLEEVRRRLKREVDRLLQHATLQEVKIEVVRQVAQVLPATEKLAMETSMFVVRKRERGGSGGSGCDGAAVSKEHAWELVQVAPDAWACEPSISEDTLNPKVAHLEPERVEVPLGVRRVLRDAHARLGGTACGSKQAIFVCFPSDGSGAGQLGLLLERDGALEGTLPPRLLASSFSSLLRRGRMAEVAPVHVACRDAEAAQRAGLVPGSMANVILERRIWRLEGLVWQQRQQHQQQDEDGRKRWERHGGAGRRGRRRREPGVLFELGPWGEERRALSHWEAASELVVVLRQAGTGV